MILTKRFSIVFLCLLLTQIALCQTDEKRQSDFFGKKSKQENRSLLKSAFSKKEKPEKRGLLSSPFARKERTKREKKNPFLPDFYAKAVDQLAERSQLPSFFNSALEKEKQRTQQPDFFSKGIFKTKRTEPGDYFSKSVFGKKRGIQADHFSSGVSEKEHSEDDLTSGKVMKKKVGNRFIGERFRLFTRDPNQKKKPKKSKKKRDPFGKKKRDLDNPQSPRNEMDLFPGGVLPKMKDMR